MIAWALIALGGGCMLSQIPADRPWQALVAVGLVLLVVGGVMVTDGHEGA